MIDAVENNPQDIFRDFDGKTVKRFNGGTTTLDLKDAVVEPYLMTARERFLFYILNPNFAFLLGALGVACLDVEFTHPGLILPGVVGGVSLILALVGMQVLPINLFGVLLMIAALGLFILEAKYTSHGLLALGGVVAMLLGAMLLIRSPMTGLSVSLGTALGVTVPFGILTIFVMRQVINKKAEPSIAEWKD